MEFWLNEMNFTMEMSGVNRLERGHHIYSKSERNINQFIKDESKKYKSNTLR